MAVSNPTNPDSNRRFALIIANSDYKEDPDLSMLIAPAQDADALYSVLKDPNIGGFDDVRIIKNQPSYEVSKEIQTFLNERRPTDMLLLYFSCHGIKNEDGQLYFAATNTRRTILDSTAVSADFINRVMFKSRSKSQILVLDCCYSGAFTRGFIPRTDKTIHTKEYFDQGRGRVVLAASGTMQYSFEENTLKAEVANPGSIFTRVIVEGMKTGKADLNQDGMISYSELYEYTHDRVIDITSSQIPEMSSVGVAGDLFIAKNPFKVANSPKTTSEQRQEEDPSKLLLDERIDEFNKIRKERDIPVYLRKLNLSGKRLRGIDLHDADLIESNLSKTKLNDSDLQGAKLKSADLSGADLRGSKLYGANLAYANLSRADLRGSDLKGMIDFTGADLTGADMRAVDLDGMVNFNGAILHDVDFTGSRTDKVLLNFNGADIQNIKGIHIPIPSEREHEQTTNEFVETLKPFSEAIAQKFKASNLPAEGLKPIEEDVKELGKYLAGNERKNLTSIEQEDLRTKIAALVGKVVRTIPVQLSVDLFASLEPLSKLTGEDVRQIVLNTQKQLAYSKRLSPTVDDNYDPRTRGTMPAGWEPYSQRDSRARETVTPTMKYSLGSRYTAPVSYPQDMEHDLTVRINGTLPDLSVIGDEEKSERAAEVKKMELAASTSCSVFTKNTSGYGKNEVFHLLVDIGEGVVRNLERGSTPLVSEPKIFGFPSAVLITHPHEDHIKELPLLANKISKAEKLNIYCTKECHDQITNKFPELRGTQSSAFFNTIKPNETFQVGPFSVTPILASHGENSPPGSVIYVVITKGKKIIFAWDFVSLPNSDEYILWNPDLLILGTQTYNPHPEETGMISVTDAYLLVRRWNARECYLVHYGGLTDFQEGRSQWFRGPTKAMTTTELQKTIESHLAVTGDSGRFKITVAKEGMIWTPKKTPKYSDDENMRIGNAIVIDGLNGYVCKIEKLNKENKLKIEIEDRINRYTLQFNRPKRAKNNDQLVYGSPEIALLSRGPELRMEVITEQGKENAVLKVNAFKYGSKDKKYVFHDDILINQKDAQKLKKYFQENFEQTS